MHTTRSPCSIPTSVPGDALDLSLSGSQLSVSRRPGSASPGKYFSRSVSMSVASESRAKRNTLSDSSFGSSRSIKNLRRSNSTTQVNQQANSSSQEQTEEYLSLFNSSSDGHKKLASLSKTSPDRTTWNILDDQPRAPALHSSPRSTRSMDSPRSHSKPEPGFTLAATFTANNRSNKGAVGNSVTTILHNNYSEKPLTPKSSNQKPTFNNILKATANDDMSLEGASLTKSQKNFCSSASNNRSPASAQCSSPVLPQRREATEEEAERFIQQVNQAAVTIQRWYRRHAGRRLASHTALRRFLASKRKEWEESRLEQQQQQEQQQQLKVEDRKKSREEKARLARLAVIQELEQKRARQAAEAPSTVEAELEGLSTAGGRSPLSPADIKAKNTDFNLKVASEVGELSFRAISPALSNNRGSQCSQDEEDAVRMDLCLEPQCQEGHRKHSRREKVRLACLTTAHQNVSEQMQPKRPQQAAEARHRAEPEQDKTLSSSVVRKRVPKNPVVIKSRVSPTDTKAKNTDSNLNIIDDIVELSSFRALSPASSNGRASHSSQEILQRAASSEEPRDRIVSSRGQDKATLKELLDTLKVLQEEPEGLPQPKFYRKEKYAWINEDRDANCLTTDNLERHSQLSSHPALPDGGALLNEAKLQTIMSFLDEMKRSEQERPSSVTSGSHREAVLSEEELLGAEPTAVTAPLPTPAPAPAPAPSAPASAPAPAAATAPAPTSTPSPAELNYSKMRIKLELEEKTRAINMLQAALAQQTELTVKLDKELKLQKEQYETTIFGHLSFIDQLISDKKVLTERCEGVLAELKQVDQMYSKKISQMEEQNEMVWQILGPLCEEIKKLKELMSATEKVRREKWINEKTKKIKEMTVKGLEPEIQKLISKHKQELNKLQTLHEAELLQADQRASQHYDSKCEELRQQLEREKEEQCLRERELAKQRYEKQLQEEELSLQQQRRRLYKEVAEEKEMLAQLVARQRTEQEDLRRQLEDNSSLAERALREEMDKSHEEQRRRHQEEMKDFQERLDIERQIWEENYKKEKEMMLMSREREMLRKRDKDIELAIKTLEEVSSKDREEYEKAAENRLKRVREKYEAELKEERAAVEKLLDQRKQQVEMEMELNRLRLLLRQKEHDIEDLVQTRERLEGERPNLAELIRQDFANQLDMLEEENRRLKVEMTELQARGRMEVERINREKEEELAEVLQRVKAAILKKEETVNSLRKQLEAAMRRADHLEVLWGQQRKQLQEK